MFDWSGKNGDKSGEKSGNFDILCEWQPYIYIYIYIYIHLQLHTYTGTGVYLIIKQPAILTLSQYMCICTYSKTAGKMTVTGNDYCRLLAFK